ncbi:Uncharacterised protein [Burkholderia pseudomallei]|nr:Uncharacterised protein [Burkholderia pseudomallei]
MERFGSRRGVGLRRRTARSGERGRRVRQRLQRGVAVLPRRGELAKRRGGNRRQRAIAPACDGRQKRHAVPVDEQHDIPALRQRGFVSIERGLDRDDADGRARGLARITDRHGQKVTGLPGGIADAIEAAESALHRVGEVWSKRVVRADEAARLIAVARGERLAASVHHIRGGQLGVLLHRVEIRIRLVAQRALARIVQEARQHRLERGDAGNRFVTRELRFERQRVQRRALRHLVHVGAEVVAQRDRIAEPGRRHAARDHGEHRRRPVQPPDAAQPHRAASSCAGAVGTVAAGAINP